MANRLKEEVHRLPAEIKIKRSTATSSYPDLPTPSSSKMNFLDTKKPERGLSENLKIAEAVRHKWGKERIYQESARVVYPGNRLSVIAVGDVHFGSVYADTQTFMKHIQWIMDTPGVAIIFMGNLIDNAIPAQFPDSMLANSLHPMDQALAMRDLIHQLDAKGKVLGAVKAPCHEGWTWKKAGVDMNDIIFDENPKSRNYPILENGGNIVVEMPGGVEYNLALYHQFDKMGSKFNNSHAVMQQLRMTQRGKADVVVAGHSHEAEAMQTYYGDGQSRKPVVMLRSGAYKGNVTGEPNGIADMWQRDQSGRDGELSGETVTLFGGQKEMRPYLKLETGIRHHRAGLVYDALKEAGRVDEAEQLLQKYEARAGITKRGHQRPLFSSPNGN